MTPTPPAPRPRDPRKRAQIDPYTAMQLALEAIRKARATARRATLPPPTV